MCVRVCWCVCARLYGRVIGIGRDRAWTRFGRHLYNLFFFCYLLSLRTRQEKLLFMTLEKVNAAFLSTHIGFTSTSAPRVSQNEMYRLPLLLSPLRSSPPPPPSRRREGKQQHPQGGGRRHHPKEGGNAALLGWYYLIVWCDPCPFVGGAVSSPPPCGWRCFHPSSFQVVLLSSLLCSFFCDTAQLTRA